MNTYLGIDIGTSGCKIGAFDGQGTLVGLARREYPMTHFPDGGAELDSMHVMACCRDAVREAVSGLPPVAALAVSSQGEAFTALDADGRPLCNAMVSSDRRALAYVRRGIPGIPVEDLYAVTGHTPHPMFTLYKLCWLRETRPEIWAHAKTFLCFEDLLHARLGVDPAMGWPLAGRTMLFDVTRHRWDPRILNEIGLMPGQLARPLPSGSVAGRIPAEHAVQWGLPDGVMVVTGGHDQPCGALGAGVTEDGMAMYATGTVDCITPAFSRAVFSPALMNSNLCTYDHAAPGLYATVAFNLTGGNMLQWIRDRFGEPEQRAASEGGPTAYERLLDLAGETPSGLLCLPYLASSGTPYFDAVTPGLVLGLRLETTRAEWIRGLLEGVILEMRLNLEILEAAGCRIRELRVIGGGAQSDAWNRMRADVLNLPVTTLRVSEAGCLGAALLAASAHTGQSVHSLATEWVRPRDVIQPRPDAAQYYTRRFDVYRDLYPAARELAGRL